MNQIELTNVLSCMSHMCEEAIHGEWETPLLKLSELAARLAHETGGTVVNRGDKREPTCDENERCFIAFKAGKCALRLNNLFKDSNEYETLLIARNASYILAEVTALVQGTFTGAATKIVADDAMKLCEAAAKSLKESFDALLLRLTDEDSLTPLPKEKQAPVHYYEPPEEKHGPGHYEFAQQLGFANHYVTDPQHEQTLLLVEKLKKENAQHVIDPQLDQTLLLVDKLAKEHAKHVADEAATKELLDAVKQQEVPAFMQGGSVLIAGIVYQRKDMGWEAGDDCNTCFYNCVSENPQALKQELAPFANAFAKQAEAPPIDFAGKSTMADTEVIRAFVQAKDQTVVVYNAVASTAVSYTTKTSKNPLYLYNSGSHFQQLIPLSA